MKALNMYVLAGITFAQCWFVSIMTNWDAFGIDRPALVPWVLSYCMLITAVMLLSHLREFSQSRFGRVLLGTAPVLHSFYSFEFIHLENASGYHLLLSAIIAKFVATTGIFAIVYLGLHSFAQHMQQAETPTKTVTPTRADHA